ncbi:MAG: hypothetical protein RLZZ595_420 [Bacteroidota bacterium]|jgi:16S rRNA (cytosine967-C5)-methyltransferase
MGAYFYSYLNTAQSVLAAYRFEQPFHLFLKSFFKRNKKYGSRDRKTISNLCYGFFRIGDAAAELTFNDQVAIGYFLTHTYDNGLLALLQPDWISHVHASTEEKFAVIQSAFVSFDKTKLFPGIENLSESIDEKIFKEHHFQQPDFFLRIRPGKKATILNKFSKNQVAYKEVKANTLWISAGTDVQDFIDLDKDAVVQDISSQATMDFFPSMQTVPVSVWDACAGSGGKSIMAADTYPNVQLFVSDIREEILLELNRRFSHASIVPQSMFCTDLQNSLSKQVVDSNLPVGGVDLIIADVPCTGSGTWARSPEWLKAFDLELIAAYQERQKKIVANLPAHLNEEGNLLYITCSVFKQENEEVVTFLQTNSGLQLVKQSVVHEPGGDYLFAALFSKKK